MVKRSSMPVGPKAASAWRFDGNSTIERFRRDYRLTRKEQFDRVLSSRTIHLRCGCFRLYAAPNDGDSARLGLIVGKRQLKRAIDRNHVKRVLRETFRINRSVLPGFDIVVQLADAPSKEPIMAQALTMWPRFVSAIGTEHDQRHS
jgi:ribonuclease P protein component